MSTVTPLTTSATVTIDNPALAAADPVAERAKQIVAKQQQRLAESTQLVVTAVLDALETRPAIRDSERFKIGVDDDALRKYRSGSASEAASYGISPYLHDASSLDLLKESVRAALGGAFGTAFVSATTSALIIEIGVAKNDAPAEAAPSSRALVPAGSNDQAITKAITGQLTARRDDLEGRRSYFSNLAKTPAMRAIAKLAKARFKGRQMITLQSTYGDKVLLRGDGQVVGSNLKKLADDALLALDMNTIAGTVERILSDATSGTLPTCERWRTPWGEFWNNF